MNALNAMHNPMLGVEAGSLTNRRRGIVSGGPCAIGKFEFPFTQ